MKLFAAALLLGLAFAGNANAAVDTDVTASVESQYVDRGMLLDDSAIGRLNMRFNDVFTKGIFVDANFVTANTTQNDMRFQSEAGLGYSTGTPLNFTVGVYRVFNSGRYGDDVTEARAETSYNVAHNVRVFGRVGQLVGSDTYNDTYFAAGTTWTAFNKLDLTVLASGYHYRDGIGETKFNNAEVTANYALGHGLNLYGTYSNGGNDRFGADLGNHFVAGVSYQF